MAVTPSTRQASMQPNVIPHHNPSIAEFTRPPRVVAAYFTSLRDEGVNELDALRLTRSLHALFDAGEAKAA